jgi:hypothetical protein
MIKVDFEFVSTHRNRSVWPNPCLFEVPWSGNGQSVGLNAEDPVSNQVPELTWIGQNISISVSIISATDSTVIVSSSANSLSIITNFYQGAILTVPSSSFRIEGYKFITQAGSLDYAQLTIKNFNVNSNSAIIQVINIPNTIYVPTGSELDNSYIGKYLYNDTLGEFTYITNYDSEFHKVMASIPSNWSMADKYNIRDKLPLVDNFAVGPGNTNNTVNLSGVGTIITPGDFIRVISTNQIVMITKYDNTTNLAIVSPVLSSVLTTGSIIEILSQTSDNYKTLSYSGTSVGQYEQTTYEISLISGSLPNIPIKNGIGGYGVDYPFLYVELYDTFHPLQSNLYSNNHSHKSYFKVTTPTGKVVERNEQFTKFTGDLNVKTIRFRTTSNFRIAWRLPSGEEIKFEEEDTKSPQVPNPKLQTAVTFNLKRV